LRREKQVGQLKDLEPDKMDRDVDRGVAGYWMAGGERRKCHANMGFHLLFVVLFCAKQPGPPAPPAFTVTVAPNPVTSGMRFIVKGLPANESLRIMIFRSNGITIYRGSMRTTGDVSEKYVVKPAARAGMYYYSVTRKKNSQVVRGRIQFL
jgi:hypothetical protein